MKYFVLKPEGIDAFAEASRAALRAYAKVVVTADRELSDELWMWAQKEDAAAEVKLNTETYALDNSYSGLPR